MIRLTYGAAALLGGAPLAIVLLAGPAQADCYLDIVRITCDATTIVDGPDAIETRPVGPFLGSFVNVLTGAEINTRTTFPGSGAIDFSDGIAVVARIEEGARVTGGYGIAGGPVSEITNLGDISGVGPGVWIVGAFGNDVNSLGFGGPAVITNGQIAFDSNGQGIMSSATISSERYYGVGLGLVSDVMNFGTFEGYTSGLQMDGSTATNYGVIRNTFDPADGPYSTGTGFGPGGVVITGGSLSNMAGALIEADNAVGVRVLGTNTLARPDSPSGVRSDTVATIINSGTIRGTVGIDGTTPAARITARDHLISLEGGTIEGTSGLAMSLGAGEDAFFMHGGASLIGGADFGDGKDTLTFQSDYEFFEDFAGGAMIDGGLGLDSMVFSNLLIEDFDLLFDDGAGALSLRVDDKFELNIKSWESFEMADSRQFSASAFADELRSMPAPVPLPASLWMFATGFLALGALRRRRRAHPTTSA